MIEQSGDLLQEHVGRPQEYLSATVSGSSGENLQSHSYKKGQVIFPQ